MMRSTLTGLVLMVLLAIANCKVVSAQVLASITGTVVDRSGSAIPDAKVTATDSETGVSRTVPSAADGSYEVLSLPVGRYDLTVEKTGFKTSVQKGIDLVVGQQAVVNAKLELGEVRESVTVTDAPIVVNITTSQVSGLVGESQVKDLPLNGRSYDNLITLNPATFNNTSHTTTSTQGLGSGNFFAVNGRRPAENLFLLNGVELTGNSGKEVTPGGASGQLLGIDGIREFNVLTDAYSAEYGKRPGGQILIVTESGSNLIHGTVFEFLRNSHLDARNYFDAPPSQIGHRIPEFQRNQFGGSLGGPIRKDKIFIFGNYEGLRQRLGVSDVSIVPDNDARLGLLPNAQGVPTPVPGLVPAMLPFFQFWPLPNGAELGGGLAYNLSAPKQSIREDYGTARVDETLSSRDTLSEIYTVDDGYNDTPQKNPFFIANTDIRYQVASLQETHIFSPRAINTFRFGFSRAAYRFNVPPNGITFPADLSLFAGLEPGAMTIGGGGSFAAVLSGNPSAGSGSQYSQGARNLFTYGDDVQLIRGKNQISFGVWFQRLQDNRQAQMGKAGLANFGSLTTFLQGITSLYEGTPVPIETGYRMLMGAWYVEDNIKVRRNLTVRVGLRHEFDNGWPAVDGRVSTYGYTNGIMNTVATPGVAFTVNKAKWLFGPRVGVAWDVFGTGKTAVRAAFGTYYYLYDALGNGFDKNPPNSILVFGQNVPFLPLFPVQPGVPGPPQCNVGVPKPCSLYTPGGMPPNSPIPTIEEWNLSIEQQITSTTAFRLGYAGSHGFHEFASTDYNAIHPLICSDSAGCVSGGINKTQGLVPQGTLYVPVGTRPNPNLSGANMAASFGTSLYNALQVELTQRASKGLQFRANYTWAKNLDILSAAGVSEGNNETNTVSNPYNPKADWGPSSMTPKHLANVSAIYELPIGKGRAWLGQATGATDKLVSGWQLNAILTTFSGLPFTVQDGNNQSGNGMTQNPDRPSLNPTFTGPVITGTPTQWYNPKAFVLPVSGTFGNVGRDSYVGPGLTELDMSLFKDTPLTERLNLEFRAEAFNILNQTNLSIPNLTVFAGGAINPAAGLITSTTTTSRQLQFGLKLIF